MSDNDLYALTLKAMRARMAGDWQAERDARDQIQLLERKES